MQVEARQEVVINLGHSCIRFTDAQLKIVISGWLGLDCSNH